MVKKIFSPGSSVKQTPPILLGFILSATEILKAQFQVLSKTESMMNSRNLVSVVELSFLHLEILVLVAIVISLFPTGQPVPHMSHLLEAQVNIKTQR